MAGTKMYQPFSFWQKKREGTSKKKKKMIKFEGVAVVM